MPPFRPGWILLQVSRPASRTVPQRVAGSTVLRANSFFSTSQNRSRETSSKNDSSEVRLYDQASPKGKLRRIHGNELDESDPLERELEEDIGDSKRLSQAAGDPFEELFNDDTPEDLEALLADDEFSTPQEGDTIEKILGIDSFEDDGDGTNPMDRYLQEGDVFGHQILVDRTLPHQSQVYLAKLNNVLNEVAMQPDNNKARGSAWVWYERCKTNVPNFLRIIPRPAWDLLQQSQSAHPKGFPEQTSRLRVLSRDKRRVGWELSEREQLVEIEGDFLEGRRDEAIGQWEDLRKRTSAPSSSLLRSGIRMFGLLGDFQRAEAIMREFVHHCAEESPREALLPLITASCLGAHRDLTRSVRLYELLRESLGSAMRMSDYDTVSDAFLAAGEKDAALAVFRDMMLDGESRSKPEMQQGAIHSRIARLVGDGGDAKDTNRAHLHSLHYLPRRFQNKIFYASWLKKLIGQGDVDSASKVVDLMYERGVQPDAKHMNGLLTAWMREGTSSSRHEAESRGWAMIQRRLDFVSERAHAKDDEGSPPSDAKVAVEALKIDLYAKKRLPAATIETFCIMAQHYLRRSMFGHVRHLRDLLDAAEIPLNSFFMNHLLHAELRSRGPRAAWSRFSFMSRNTKPDMETYMVMWEALQRQMNVGRGTANSDGETFVTPRRLFAQMMEWYQSLNSFEKGSAAEDMNTESLNDIIGSFCLAKDVSGAFTALAILHRDLEQQANSRTAHALIGLIASLNIPKRDAHRSPARRRKNNNLGHATAILDQVRQQRRKLIIEAGGVDPWQHRSFEHVLATHRGEKEDAMDKTIMRNRPDPNMFTHEELIQENTKVLLTFLFAVIKNRWAGENEEIPMAILKSMDEMKIERFDLDEVMSLSVKS